MRSIGVPGFIAGLVLLVSIGWVIESALAPGLEGPQLRAAGMVFGQLFWAWVAWVFVKWKRKPQQPPALYSFLLLGTAALFLVVYSAKFLQSL